MPSEIAVTLICTAEQRATLQGLIPRLELAGLSLRVLFDAQREPERVAEVIDSIGERGLFVLCESGQTDEFGFRRIESAIAKHGTALHRLIRLDLLGRAPMVLVTRIVRECEELAKLESSSSQSGAKPPPTELAPTDELAGISLPAIRLDPGEQLEGDTLRIDLPGSQKLIELARERKALRERGQLPVPDVGGTVGVKRMDRKIVILLAVAAALLLTVLVGLLVAG